MAKTTIGVLNVKLKATTASFRKGMQKAAERTRKFRKGLKKASVVVGAFGAAAATAAAYGLVRLAKSQMEVIDSTAKFARLIGVSSAELTGMEFAAAKAGVASEKLRMGMQRMTRRIAEAAAGTGEAKAAIAELGLEANDLKTAGPIGAFKKLSEAMGGVKDQGDKVRLAMKLFDSEGVALLNVMSGGSAAIDEAMQSTKAFGTALGDNAHAKVEAATNSMTVLAEVFKGVGTTLAVKVAPFIIAIANRFTEAGKSGTNFGDSIKQAFSLALDYVGLFGDGVQMIVPIFLKVQRFMLTILDMVRSFGRVFIKVLNYIDPTPVTDFALAINDEIGSVIDKIKEGSKEVEKFFGGDDFSKKLKRGLRQVQDEAKVAADAILSVGSTGEVAGLGAAGSDKRGEFRQVVLSRTAGGGSGQTRTDTLLQQLVAYSREMANNTRTMGVN